MTDTAPAQEPQTPPQPVTIVMDNDSLVAALDQMTGMYAQAVRELVMYRAVAEALQRQLDGQKPS